MVVSAIFVILSAVVLASNSRFGSVIVLQNLTHDIALTIRESQVYGIAVRRFDPTVGIGSFEYGYGMHFTSGTTYELFADANANGIWDSGETVRQTTLAGGYSIADLCAPAGVCGRERLDILFKRPEPDACISTNGTVTLSDASCISTIQRAQITVQSPREDEAHVVVESSGQISVQ